MIIVTSMAIALHYEHQKLAPVIDRFWRCSIGKAFDDFLVPLIQVWRLLYALVVPIVNFYGAIVAQIVRGTPIILAKCQISELLAPVSHSADALKEFFYALGHLFGIACSPDTDCAGWTRGGAADRQLTTYEVSGLCR